mmetsp:Transcript_79786/g.140791  ORF Transcript_79786/g.140791 Transcript_79786/m.140791 type:complete len:139 (+) Transcript_79786:2175-2591(+)
MSWPRYLKRIAAAFMPLPAFTSTPKDIKNSIKVAVACSTCCGLLPNTAMVSRCQITLTSIRSWRTQLRMTFTSLCAQYGLLASLCAQYRLLASLNRSVCILYASPRPQFEVYPPPARQMDLQVVEPQLQVQSKCHLIL